MCDIEGLTNRVCNFQTVAQSDKWVCNMSSDGIFHVNALRTRIDWRNLMTGEVTINWTHEIPLKVNCFMWRAKLDRIPTACALLRRSIQITSAICSIARRRKKMQPTCYFAAQWLQRSRNRYFIGAKFLISNLGMLRNW